VSQVKNSTIYWVKPVTILYFVALTLSYWYHLTHPIHRLHRLVLFETKILEKTIVLFSYCLLYILCNISLLFLPKALSQVELLGKKYYLMLELELVDTHEFINL
jgi:hypothetical protein